MSTDSSVVSTKTYKGSCHCKKFSFEFDAPGISKSAECNCSICSRRGYLFGFSDRKTFKFTSGSFEELSDYQFGKKRWSHVFCPTCGAGIGAFGTGSDTILVNLTNVEGVNKSDLQVDKLDGASAPL